MNSKDKTLEYHVERLSNDNLTDVEKLHTGVYGKVPPPGLFSMKYDTAFTGIQHIGFVAYNGQLPIAFYAVIPCFLKIDDEIVLVAQSADTMTHPEYRTKGLFVELAMITYQLCENSGIRLVFGFPNQNSLPGFINKLGWKMTERMDCFIITAAKFSLSAFLKKIPVLKNWYAGLQQRLLRKYVIQQQGIANSVLNDGYAGVCRDNRYLKYKTYSDTHIIKIDNATLWIKMSSILLIGDISIIPEDFEDMMNKLKKLTRKMGLKEIHFHASPGTTLHSLFAKNIKSIPSFPVIFKDLAGGVPIDKIKFTSADIDTF
jgi:hypothetical protein